MRTFVSHRSQTCSDSGEENDQKAEKSTARETTGRPFSEGTASRGHNQRIIDTNPFHNSDAHAVKMAFHSPMAVDDPKNAACTEESHACHDFRK
jgi:hypothetical protein